MMKEYFEDLGKALLFTIVSPLVGIAMFAVTFILGVGYTLRAIIDIIGDTCYIISMGFDSLGQKAMLWAIKNASNYLEN